MTDTAVRKPRLLDLLSPCVFWTGWRNDDGYGYVWDGRRDRPAHRVAYEREVGLIPQGLELDHVCRNRACVNVAHLEVVTHAENRRRSGLAQTACRRSGHDWSDSANVYVRRDGRRWCAACARADTNARRTA